MKSYKELLDSSYEEIVSELNSKYGPVSGPYFLTSECKSGNGTIKRTKEGLYVHHVREDKEPLLCDGKIARTLPFDFQQPENLVYCNLLEHFILHIKIYEMSEGRLSYQGMSIMNEQLENHFIYKHEPKPSNWYFAVIDAIRNYRADFMLCQARMNELLDKYFKLNTYTPEMEGKSIYDLNKSD